MNTFTVNAVVLANGIKVSAKVQAASENEAELIAGRKFLEAGFKGDQIKIVSVGE